MHVSKYDKLFASKSHKDLDKLKAIQGVVSIAFLFDFLKVGGFEECVDDASVQLTVSDLSIIAEA